jgi:hypothetical protein
VSAEGVVLILLAVGNFGCAVGLLVTAKVLMLHTRQMVNLADAINDMTEVEP